MKLNSKATLAFLLAALAISPVLMTACAESKDKEVASSTGGADIVSDTDDGETTLHMPDVPEEDYGSRFIFLTSGSDDDNGVDWITYDVWVEETDAEPINDAVFKRNGMILDHLGITIEEVKTASGQTVLAVAQRAIQSNSPDYDAVMTSVARGLTMGQNGQVYNLNEMPYINLENEWWDQKCTEETRILGKNYFATGDITVIDNDATWTLMFNKQMIEDLTLDVPYELVKSDAWTFDKFGEMIKAGAQDLNSDGKMRWTQDQFGFVTTSASGDGLFYAAGARLVTLDEDLYPTSAINEDFLSTVVEKAGEIFSDKNTVIDNYKNGNITTVQLRNIFEQGRGLFFGEVMQCITRMRDSETDFGVIPWPKLNENQEEYYNMTHNTATKGIVVPLTQADLEKAGAVLEYMAGVSKYTLTVAYYDVCITSKYVRDLESADMLDIILASRVYDLGYICDFGGLYSGVTGLIRDGKTNVASTISSKLKAFNKAMEKMTQKFEDNAS